MDFLTFIEDQISIIICANSAKNVVRMLDVKNHGCFVSVLEGKSEKVVSELQPQDPAGPLSVASSDISVPTPRLNQAIKEVGLSSGLQTNFPGNDMVVIFFFEIHDLML